MKELELYLIDFVILFILEKSGVKKQEPNYQIVLDFIYHTKTYCNHKENGLNPNEDRKLEQILEQYKTNIKTFNSNDVKRSLKALTCWPEAKIFIENKKHFLPSPTDVLISDFVVLFR